MLTRRWVHQLRYKFDKLYDYADEIIAISSSVITTWNYYHWRIMELVQENEPLYCCLLQISRNNNVADVSKDTSEVIGVFDYINLLTDL